MKKLMIAVAAATMVSGAFAIGKAQVYDYTATIKTSACRAAKLSNSLVNYFNERRFFPSAWSTVGLDRGDEIGVRKQVSLKIAGVIWGCDCITISMPGWRRLRGRYFGGYYFWNQQTERIYNPWRTTFMWNVLNRIDTMTKCEGSYMLFCTQAGQRIFVFGGGFGTVTDTGCDTYVKSMSGNLSGVSRIPTDAFGCVLCGGNNCVVATLCDRCYDVIDPAFVDTTPLSAVSGTWKIKYNKSATRRISSVPWISRSYTFKKGGNTTFVATMIDRAYAAANGLRYSADGGGSSDYDSDEYEEKMAEYAEEHELVTLDDLVETTDENFEDTEMEQIIKEWDSEQENEDDDGFIDLVKKIAEIIADLS